MRYKEIIRESMPDKKAIAKLKQDAKEIKAMADSGNMDINKAMPMMQNMAKIAARADYGSKFLAFAKKMAGAIKKGIDTNQYNANDLPTMQKAYDEIIAQMPNLQKMADESRALYLKYGRTDREKASLDDKGNYKGTNIKPTAQQAQQLAREVYDPKHGHDTNSHVVKHKDDNGKAYWAVYNHNKGKGGKIVKTFYSEKGASDFAKKNHDALMSDKLKANEDTQTITVTKKNPLAKGDLVDVQKMSKSAKAEYDRYEKELAKDKNKTRKIKIPSAKSLGIGEDMNAIIAKQGKKKHGQKYMDAARAMAQEKGRKLTPAERDKLRDKHSDNRKKANETVAGDVGSVAQNMTPGKMISRNMYNSNGTMKNGLDYGNILGGPSKPKKAKKRRV